MKEILKFPGIVTRVENTRNLERGSIIRRVSTEKDQQGCFMNFDERGDLIIVNVIDCANVSFLAPAGIMRIKNDETLYRYNDCFGDDDTSKKAITIIREWTLFSKNPDLEDAILYFVKTAYSPSQIIYLRDNDLLKYLFVPVQQKFMIGRFQESVDWDHVRKQTFLDKLIEMRPGDHITYIALIPQQKTHRPMFYTIGTKPHQETEMSLRSEPYNFVPTHGGHIKALKLNDGNMEYIVDAGSNFLGRGTGASLDTAKDIVKRLKQLYGNLIFKPVEGRGAFGTDQSY